jgi:acetyl coenzyme A synthetase (ADP forming)-like protein
MERFEGDVVLRDGSLVHVRRSTDQDKALLTVFLKGLSERALLSRFLKWKGDRSTLLGEIVPKEGRFTLVAIREEKVVAQAQYEISAPGTADIGVAVTEDFQRKGLGSILLGQLCQAAAESGISTFDASTRADTHSALEFVRRLGSQVQVRAGHGFVRVTFPTSIAPAGLEAFELRETLSATAAVRRFLKARSVAVIGASRDKQTIGGALFKNIIESDFNGPVYPVNRDANVVQSVAAYKSVLDCPGPVDLAFVAVPAKFVTRVAKECAEKGVPAIVVISSGFAEVGEEGAKLQEELVEVCREAGMRLIGPNCMGIVNTEADVRLNGQFAPPAAVPGRIGFLSQSGSLGYVIIDMANRLGIGMSSFISVGNKADISANDLLEYWESDENTDVVLLHLESFGNPRKFARLAKRISRKKPIVVVKSGRHSAGFRATQSHTGAVVAASDVSVDALFRQSGVIRTDSLEETFDVAALLSTQPLPKGDGVAIITNAGGPGILAADTCEGLGIRVPELSKKTRGELAKFLLPIAGTKNPVDMTSAATAGDYGRAIRTVATDENVDSLLVIFIPPMAVRTEDVAGEIIRATSSLKGRIPVMTNFMAAKGISGQLSDGHVRIPSYQFPEDAAKALAHAVWYGKWLTEPSGVARIFPNVRRLEAAAIVSKALAGGGGWLGSSDTDRFLQCYGIPLAKSVTVDSPQDAARVARTFSGKVALKASAPGLLHKTELGAVKVDLTQDHVEGAAREMVTSLRRAGIEGASFLIQEMVPDAVEMFVGVTNDPNFGPLIACGAGGALVELLRDVSVRLTPLTDLDARQMIRSLKTFPILEGYRGGPRQDIEALEEILLRVGQMVEDMSEIAELDLNPVMIRREGSGAVVVDARVRIGESAPELPLGAKKH